MAGSTTTWADLLQDGPKQTDYRTNAATGYLFSSVGLLSDRFLSTGDHYAYSNSGAMVDSTEAASIASSGDSVFSSISVERGKKVGRWDWTKEFSEDSLAPQQPLMEAAWHVSNAKDSWLDDVLALSLSSLEVANLAAVTISDIANELGELPTCDESPVLFMSSKLQMQLVGELTASGSSVEHGMILGLAVLPFEPIGFADASGDTLCLLGHPTKAALAAHSDHLVLTQEALGASGALNDMESLIVNTRLAGLVRDSRWMRRISVV